MADSKASDAASDSPSESAASIAASSSATTYQPSTIRQTGGSSDRVRSASNLAGSAGWVNSTAGGSPSCGISVSAIATSGPSAGLSSVSKSTPPSVSSATSWSSASPPEGKRWRSSSTAVHCSESKFPSIATKTGTPSATSSALAGVPEPGVPVPPPQAASAAAARPARVTRTEVRTLTKVPTRLSAPEP